MSKQSKQVDKSKYKFRSYCGADRWASYWHQLDEVLALSPKTILEIGVGDGVFKNYIKNNTDIEYKNLDIAEDLNPDIIGSVENINLPDNSVDLVCAFEILEHLPFDKFEKCLTEIRRVSKSDVVISLPHFGHTIKFSFKIPFLKEKKISFKIPHHPKHKFNGQHYWEIGKKGYSSSKIRKIISKYFKIRKNFIPFNNQYHYFYILEK
ncbi:MAG TPA: class I SAM-dependent methyltransferase [Ignavibacteria bacterium]|nr:class I SAM-dependent methyltransferase [Ignavibacteria bacterium]